MSGQLQASAALPPVSARHTAVLDTVILKKKEVLIPVDIIEPKA
jgi:hypothetical protein